MTRSNRTLNRLLLALVGLLVLAAAAWLGTRTDTVGALVGWSAPDIPTPTDTAWWIAAGAAAVLAILAIAWAASRGRGRIADVHDEDGLRVSHEVADGILRGELAGRPDIASVSARAYRVQGRRVLLVDVAAVRGARLPRLLDAARSAVAVLDGQLERSIPVVLHITSDSRVIPARDQRVD
jgi:hypothetical protein